MPFAYGVLASKPLAFEVLASKRPAQDAANKSLAYGGWQASPSPVGRWQTNAPRMGR